MFAIFGRQLRRMPSHHHAKEGTHRYGMHVFINAHICEVMIYVSVPPAAAVAGTAVAAGAETDKTSYQYVFRWRNVCSLYSPVSKDAFHRIIMQEMDRILAVCMCLQPH